MSLILKDSDTDSENHSLLIPLSVSAFCIRGPENRQFKRCIIYRYIINSSIISLISGFLIFNSTDNEFILLINVKMPTTVGILTFISRITTTSECFK